MTGENNDKFLEPDAGLEEEPWEDEAQEEPAAEAKMKAQPGTDIGATVAVWVGLVLGVIWSTGTAGAAVLFPFIRDCYYEYYRFPFFSKFIQWLMLGAFPLALATYYVMYYGLGSFSLERLYFTDKTTKIFTGLKIFSAVFFVSALPALLILTKVLIDYLDPPSGCF